MWQEYSDAAPLTFYRKATKAWDTLESVNFEAYYPSLQKWFEVSLYPSKKNLSVYLKDVTFRKKADTRLVKANERFERVMEATNEVIWDWDILNKVFYRSRGISKILDENLDMSLTEKDLLLNKFHPEDLPRIQKSINQAVIDPFNNRWEAEYRLLNAQGKTVYIRDRGMIIRDNTGDAIRMVGAMSDVTELKIQEIQLKDLNQSLKNYAIELERSNNEMEQFAFVTSHDLQEPLRMITSYMDLLKNKYGEQLDEKAHQYIYYARDGAKRMKHIILDLLDYSRSGSPDDSLAKIDLNEVLADYKQLRKRIISEKGATIKSNKLPILKSYKPVVLQILHSLFDNAIKYSKPDRSPIIEIEAIDKEKEWEFTIKDNGIGIETKNFDKIFVIFQKLHNREEYEGTGMGLSIAKRHVEFLGGKIWVESTLGQGSTFCFTIPKLPKTVQTI